MRENLGFLVEVPVSRREARTRQLPETVGKLVLYAVEKAKEQRMPNLIRLARWLSRWVGTDESLYASPIVPFLSKKKMARFLASSGLEANTVQTSPQTYLIRCSSQNDIVNLLDGCMSEAIVFITDTDGRCAHETLIAVDKYADDYRGHETPFMSRLAAHGGFFFFAETHQSVEVLGNEEFIVKRCLCPFAIDLLSARGVNALEEDIEG